MKVDLTPEQFLALYDALSYQINSTDPDTPGWNGVNEIRLQLNESILKSLHSVNVVQNQPKFVAWAEKEQQKIDKLKDDLNSLKVHNFHEKHDDDGLSVPPVTRDRQKSKKIV
jgi:uncharacterized iron-regulated protein